ncbi:MAG: tetratricopeptide repeat protein, partial [Nitrososphaeria archaeon]|nr:tetratricopeptide repeat protein [Nitrososphaeria archaeon]
MAMARSTGIIEGSLIHPKSGMKAYRIILSLMFLLLIPNHGFSQTSPPISSQSETLDYLREIDTLVRSGQYDLALERLHSHRHLLESRGEICSALAMDTWVAKVVALQNNLAPAISSLKHTKGLAKQYDCSTESFAFKNLDKALTALECHLKALDLYARKEFHEALATLAAAKDIWLEIEDQGLAIWATYMMAACYFDGGEYGEALSYFKQVLESPVSTENPPLRALTFGAIGSCYGLLGEHEKAQDFLENSLQEAKKIAIGPSTEKLLNLLVGSALYKVPYEYEMKGRYRKALLYYDYQLRYLDLTGGLNLKYAVLHRMGDIHLRLLQVEKGVECFSQMFDISQSTNDLMMQEFSLCGIATAHQVISEWEKSNQFFNRALELNPVTENLAARSMILEGLGTNYTYIG